MTSEAHEQPSRRAIWARRALKGTRFTHVAVLLAVVWLLSEARKDDRLLETIVEARTTSAMSPDERIVALVGAVHELLKPRESFVDQSQGLDPRGLFSRSTDSLYLPVERCGAYAGLLVRTLHRASIPARLGQLREAGGGRWGVHIVAEAKLSDRWVILDPAFNLAFRNRAGQLATFAEVAADWPQYQSQAPSDYPPEYRFEEIRYTNWDKVPVVLPLLRGLLLRVMGKEWVDEVCLRSHVLDEARLFARVLGGGYLVLVLALLVLSRTGGKPAPTAQAAHAHLSSS